MVCPSRSAAFAVKSRTVSLRFPGLPSEILSERGFFSCPAPMRAPPCHGQRMNEEAALDITKVLPKGIMPPNVERRRGE